MSVASGSKLRESIHSGHFMVSDFEPESEALDEDYEVGLPVPGTGNDERLVLQRSNETPEERSKNNSPLVPTTAPVETKIISTAAFGVGPLVKTPQDLKNQLFYSNSAFSIDGSLTKLFQCMSLAYRYVIISN